MTDGQIAFIVLVVLIVYEAARWLPNRSWTFQPSNTSSGWHAASPMPWLRSRGGGITWLNPFPPFRPHLSAVPIPFAPHEQGLAVWIDESEQSTLVDWELIQPRVHAQVLQLTSTLQIRFLNANQARDWSTRLQRWKTYSAEQRQEDYLSLIQRHFDLTEILAHTKQLQIITKPLRRLADLIFIWSIIVFPVIYWYFGDHLYSYLAFSTLLLMTISQSILLWKTLRHEPKLKKDCLAQLLSSAFYPPSAMRAADWICQSTTAEFHPLACMLAFSSKVSSDSAFLQHASRCWRHARWPKGLPQQDLPFEGPEVLALARFFKQHHIAIHQLETPPSNLQPGESYCPRCLTTYQPSQNRNDQPPALICLDCHGIPLLRSPQPL